jgi:5-(carboxyamino)imidazole ribonucleotide synthase
MIGAGQLARMTQQAAIPLEIELRVLAASPEDPAVLAGSPYVVGSHRSLDDLRAAAAGADAVTFDHEHVPNRHVRALAADHAVRPGPDALHLAQDKHHARRAVAAAGAAVPAFELVDAGDQDSVGRFAAHHGWPLVAKAPVGGYDGRGVAVLRSPADVAGTDLGSEVWLLEEMIDIDRELAVLVARRPSGASVVYPVVETLQRDGICHELVMPARIPDAVAEQATELALTILEGTDAAGIIATELFLDRGGRLVVNELATRPHNSGHATIEATATSQFENHLRAVLDWPLGDVSMRAPAAATVNVLGGADGSSPSARLPAALADPSVHVHLYGKQARPGRKLGHVTALGCDHERALISARRAASRLAGTEVAVTTGGTDR